MEFKKFHEEVNIGSRWSSKNKSTGVGIMGWEVIHWTATLSNCYSIKKKHEVFLSKYELCFHKLGGSYLRKFLVNKWK